MFKFSLNVNHIRNESIKLFVYFIFLFDFCFSFIWLGLVWLGFFFSFRFRFARNWYPVDMRRRFSVDYHTLFSTNLVIRFDFSQNQTESENQIENRIVWPPTFKACNANRTIWVVLHVYVTKRALNFISNRSQGI